LKKFFLSALMAVAALSASAEQPAGGLSLTPHASMGFAIASEKMLDTFDGYITAMVGVEATYKPTDLLGFSVGLDYGYGSTVKETRKVSGYEAEAYLTHYLLSVPVLAQLHFGQFAVKAGIQPGWVISPEGHSEWKSTEKNEYNISGSFNGKLKDEVNSFQCSIPVGICYSPSFPLQFDLRYNIPLTEYLKEEVANASNDHFKLGSIMLTVGYRFDFGR